MTPADFPHVGAALMSFAYPAVLGLADRPRGADRLDLAADQRARRPADGPRRPILGPGVGDRPGPGRIGPRPDPGGRDRDPGRPAAIERAPDQAGAHQHRALRRYLQQHDQPARRRYALRRLDEGDRSLPRDPQGRCLRPDLLRQQRAALGPVDRRPFGDSLRTAVHEAGERPLLDDGHDDRQDAHGLQGDPGIPRGGGPHDHPGLRRRERRPVRRQGRGDRAEPSRRTTSRSTRSTFRIGTFRRRSRTSRR